MVKKGPEYLHWGVRRASRRDGTLRISSGMPESAGSVPDQRRIPNRILDPPNIIPDPPQIQAQLQIQIQDPDPDPDSMGFEGKGFYIWLYFPNSGCFRVLIEVKKGFRMSPVGGPARQPSAAARRGLKRGR